MSAPTNSDATNHPSAAEGAKTVKLNPQAATFVPSATPAIVLNPNVNTFTPQPVVPAYYDAQQQFYNPAAIYYQPGAYPVHYPDFGYPQPYGVPYANTGGAYPQPFHRNDGGHKGNKSHDNHKSKQQQQNKNAGPASSNNSTATATTTSAVTTTLTTEERVKEESAVAAIVAASTTEKKDGEQTSADVQGDATSKEVFTSVTITAAAAAVESVHLADDDVDNSITFIATDHEPETSSPSREAPAADDTATTTVSVPANEGVQSTEGASSENTEKPSDANSTGGATSAAAAVKSTSFDRGQRSFVAAVQEEKPALWRKEVKVLRYDKAEILAVYERGVPVPDDIKAMYPDARDKGPLVAMSRTAMAATRNGGDNRGDNRGGGGGGGMKRGGGGGGSRFATPSPAPSAEDLAMFAPGRENVFKHQPTLLKDTADPEVIAKKANLILNKLSVEKFDKLAQEFMDVGIEEEAVMGRAVDLIVSKAQMEEHFCFMYADLCRKITDDWSQKTREAADGVAEYNPGKVFRGKLLERCEDEFGTDWLQKLASIRNSDMSEDDKVEKEILLKKKYTGHMIFIGEVFIQDLVRPKIMRECITRLMESQEEEHWTCMVKLMQTIGSKFDEYCLLKKKKDMKTYFEKISETSDNLNFSSRMRFMLKDLIDMRNNDWRGRRVNEKAKKLSELRTGEVAKPVTSAPVGGAAASKVAQDVRVARTVEPVDEWTTVVTKKGQVPPSVGAAKQPPVKESMARPTATKSSYSALSGSTAVRKSSATTASKKKEGKSGADAALRKEPLERAGSADSMRSVQSSSAVGSAVGDEENGEAGEAATTQDNDTGVDPESLPGFAGPLEKETIRRVCNVMDEYVTNGLYNEALISFREIIHPNGMGDALKSIIVFSLEKKEDYRKKVSTLFVELFNDEFLTTETATSGIHSFLDAYDELCIDVPKVGENMFNDSTRAAELIIKCIAEMCSSEESTTKAKEICGSVDNLGSWLLSKIFPPPKQEPLDVLNEMVAALKIPFSLVSQ